MAENIKIVASNRKAGHDYNIHDRFEAGLVLKGTEVKSLRGGRCNLKDSYAKIIDNEAWIIGLHITQYENEGYVTHEPERRRKLLLHRDEIRKLLRQVREKGMTLIPLKVYFRNGKAKIEIGVASSRRKYDKRAAIAEREQHREMKRLEKKYRIKS